ncbi:unnamed protein product [Ilex paraguariensis]|uniref:Receptor-like serine/threonine-protein kinase n=1 Tax=Ilex paraguariensis TaxID=185542 RepID=A0ABC8R0H0_9AQUA
MMGYFISIFLLPYLFSGWSAQTSAVITGSSSSISTASNIFYLNSSLPSMWYNNNSKNMTILGDDESVIRVVLSSQYDRGYVCGFYCINICYDYLLSVIVVGIGNPSVVWSANRDHPVQENATLQLTGDGDLVLRNSNGTKVWSSNTTGKSVLGLKMTEAGNLVLFNNNEAIVWQSFDHPTDTLLTGQRLNEGQRLTASASKSSWTRELYYATLTSTSGFAAYTEVHQGPPLMYYQLVPVQSSRSSGRSNYAEFQLGGFVVNLGTFQQKFARYGFNLPYSHIDYLRLDSDGHLKIYRHGEGRGFYEVLDLVSVDLGVCQYPRSCGEYGVCQEGECSCPTGLDRVQYFDRSLQSPSQGCSRLTPLSCHPSPDQHKLVEVRNVTFFNVINSVAALPNIRDINGCTEACLQNCSCGAVFFRYYHNVSDGYCFMPPEILSIREGKIPNYNFMSTTYIKVQIPYEAPSPSPRNQTNFAAIIAGSSAGSSVFVCIVIAILVMWHERNKDDEEDYIGHLPGMPKRFSFEELRVATEDFKERLGAGGFGTVFSGTLGDGTKVAVKRLDKLSQAMKEFLAEVQSIGSIHHFNLVQLIGFCAERSFKLLVYEYMSNGSLDKWIFNKDQGACLNWQAREKIILDIAKGLAYLHEECRQRIIHLDIKPQNILLDENFNAKVSDFGLAKLIDRDESQVLTTMRGTPGYLAPEWRLLRITVKVDIYSFGIVLLEIVCRRKNLDCQRSESSSHLLKLLQKKAKEDKLLDLVEHLQEGMEDHREEIVRMIKTAAWCLQDDHTRRPSMATIVKVLEGVMEVDPNISYNFTHAMGSQVVAKGRASTPPQASVLSGPR